MDAFLSYSTLDADFVNRVERALSADGLTVWVDHDNIRAGGVLVGALQEALVAAKNIVVLWSRNSSESPWVTTEWTSVVNLNHQKGTTTQKGVIPCLLDETPRALFLLNYVFCDFRSSFDDGRRALVTALRRGTAGPTPPAVPWAPSDFFREISGRQDSVLQAFGANDLARATRLQGELTPLVDRAVREHPSDDDILNLAGFDRKNRFLMRHWDDPLRFPDDPLLGQATELFFRALSIRPDNPSGLNGLGNVFFLRGDLDAAEFYIRRAIARAVESGFRYAAAEHDLGLIAQARQARTASRPTPRRRTRKKPTPRGRPRKKKT